MPERTYYIYILTNKHNTTFYIGITNYLLRRVKEHKQGHSKSFTKKYNLMKLVYYELTNDITIAIKREKQLKRWRKQWKIDLIEQVNPNWEDLYHDIYTSD